MNQNDFFLNCLVNPGGKYFMVYKCNFITHVHVLNTKKKLIVLVLLNQSTLRHIPNIVIVRPDILYEALIKEY